MGKYTGVYMKAHKILPGAKTASRVLDISPEAKRRLKWLDWYAAHGRNARLTCRHFGISPDSFYRWRKRFKPYHLNTLESISSRPKSFRKSAIPQITIDLISTLKTSDLSLSKYKMSWILKRDHGVSLSPSSCGRVLEKQGLTQKAGAIKSLKKRQRISYIIPRIRVLRELRNKCPGFLVQVDTKHLIVMGHKFYQFNAIDTFTKLSFSKAYTTISSASAKDFLDHLILFMPFKINAIQTDNGSEYLMYFHKECVKRGITHYFSHPQTPKENTFVERFIQTTEYELWLFDETLVDEVDYINQKLSAWIGRYNSYRPHQSLNYLTPMEYYQLKKKGDKVYGR